jgi:molybdate/tungstate transport system substrate-binding protein
MKSKYTLPIVLILVIFGLLVGSCAPPEQIKMRVLFAGSLIIPFDALEKAYEAEHPNVDVEMEGHGSIQAIRHVTDLHEEADLVVTADYALIPMLMYATDDPNTSQPYADWYIKFATNQLGLAYTSQSAHADEINADNWYEILTKPDVKVGISDPRFDAAGYRMLMVLQLAELAYDDPLIFENITLGQFRVPIPTMQEDGKHVIEVPELVETKADGNIVMRGSSVQLIALLQSGDIDYAIEYESVIRQHNLEVIPLPSTVDLGDPDEASRYDQVQVRLDFQRFASVEPIFNGEVIGYGVTIPTNAPHPEQAADLIAFLLGPEGQAVLEEYSHPTLDPPVADNYPALPEELQALCEPMK